MKYNNELEIKKALGIENGTWRNLTKDKVKKFAAMMPDMDKEVMMEIIRKFPEFMKYATDLLEGLRKTIETTIDKNSEDYCLAIQIIKETQSICKEQLNNENISQEERIVIWNNLMEVTKMIPDLDKGNKQFYKYLNDTTFKATALALGVALAFIGGKVALENFVPERIK